MWIELLTIWYLRCYAGQRTTRANNQKMKLIHKTRMDKNIFTALDPWILFKFKFPFFVLFFYFYFFFLVKAQQINPTYESKKSFWEEREEEGWEILIENGNNRKAVAVYFDAFALIAIILTSNTRGKLWKKGKWKEILFLIKSAIRRINHRNFCCRNSDCIIDFRLNSMQQRSDRACV